MSGRVLDLLRADPNVSADFREALSDASIERAARILPGLIADVKRDNDAALGPLAIWRERSRNRLRMEPLHSEWQALLMSLEALYEARRDGRAFSWACAPRERLAAQDWCVSRAFRKSEQ
jgi:hypothetical protein